MLVLIFPLNIEIIPVYSTLFSIIFFHLPIFSPIKEKFINQ